MSRVLQFAMFHLYPISTHAPTQPEAAVIVVVGVATMVGSGSNAHMSWHMHMGATVTNMESHVQKTEQVHDSQRCVHSRGGGLGSSTIFKNLMSPTPRRKWYLTTRRRAH